MNDNSSPGQPQASQMKIKKEKDILQNNSFALDMPPPVDAEEIPEWQNTPIKEETQQAGARRKTVKVAGKFPG